MVGGVGILKDNVLLSPHGGGHLLKCGKSAGMKRNRLNAAAIVSCALCTVLVFVGAVRLMSYSEGAVGNLVRNSVLAVLCYDPDSAAGVRFFKILATPSVIAAVYFFFRWRNAGLRSRARGTRLDHAHRLDFQSPTLRFILTSVITLHWLAMEWWKFHTEGFYPWSVLESRWLNVIVLLSGQALTFRAMKYLSFEPLFRSGGSDVTVT